MIVYKITNKNNGKIYIGQTAQEIGVRFSQHKYHAFKNKSNSVLSLAFKKYGKDSFKIEIIAKCNSIEEMNHRESYYIKLFNSLAPFGYNLDSGGKNKTMHQITKDKLSQIKIGKPGIPFTEERKQKISGILKGRKYPNKIVSEETRLKISQSRSGVKNPMYGRKHSEEVKAICSKTNLGNKYWLGRKHSEEAKARISQSRDKTRVLCVSNGIVYESLHSASLSLGVSRTSIARVIKGIAKSCKGLSFQYAESK